MKHKILLLFLLSGILYNAAKANETEPNDTKAQANTLTLNGSNSGSIGTATDVDWYKLTTNSDGKINLTLTVTNGLNAWFALYDNDGTTLLYQDYTAGSYSYSVDGLAAGTYYVKIFPYYGGQMPNYTIANTLTKPVEANDTEPDSTRAQAIVLPLNGSKTGHINYYYKNHRDSLDEYKIITNSDGALNLSLSVSNGTPVWFALYDNDGSTLLRQEYTGGNYNYTVDGLAAGTYYIKIFTYYTNNYAPYTLSNTFTAPAQANDNEPDSTRATALTLPLNGKKTGHIGYYYNNHRDSLDEYKITTNSDGALNLSLSVSNGTPVWYALYDNDGSSLLHQDYTTGSFSYTVDGLAKGTYYIKIFTYYNSQFAPYTLSDTLIVPAQANDAEPNNTKATALTLPLNATVTGNINYYYDNKRDSVDEYKLVTNADGSIYLGLTVPNGTAVWFALYDNDGSTLLHQDYTAGNYSYNVDGLAKGTYYIKIFTYYNNQFAPYTLTDTLYTYNANDVEPNKYASQAKTLLANTANNGHVGFYYDNVRDTTDWYKINYTGNNGNMTVTLHVLPHATGGANNTYMQIFADTAASPVYSDYTTGTITANLTKLDQGYYYVKIFEYYHTEFSAYTITPTFTQTKVKIAVASGDTTPDCSSNHSITYKLTKSQSPYTVQLYRFGVKYGSAKNTDGSKITFNNLPDGIYYATAYGDGATGGAKGISETISIAPSSPANLRTTAIQAKQAKLNWNTVSCAAYYIIQYHAAGSAIWDTVYTVGNTGNIVIRQLKSAKTYNWTVAAVDSGKGMFVMSAFADTASFKTSAAAFAEVSADDEDNLSAGNNKLSNATVTVFPNPVSSLFTIHYNGFANDKVAATLYNANGKSVWTSGAMNADALNGKQVMVNQFGSGLYYLKITNEKGAIVGVAKVSITK